MDTCTELLEVAVTSGLKVLKKMFEEDRTAICGWRSQHQAERGASRSGTVPSEVVLPTFQLMANKDPLNRRVIEQMLVGVARDSTRAASSPCRTRWLLVVTYQASVSRADAF